MSDIESCACDESMLARELLDSWIQLSREGAFGTAFEQCEDDCDCVVCASEAFLKEVRS